MIGHRIAYAYSGNSDPKLAHNLTIMVEVFSTVFG